MMDLDQYIEQLIRGEPLSEAQVKAVCTKLQEILLYESNVVSISAPVSMVGDLHGQFYDVLELFKVGGKPPDVNFVFLGDYVDRGHFGVLTVSLLACLKLRYPERVVLLRGNHESRAITQVYGFYAECLRHYGNANVWRFFTDMFDHLTLAAVIDNKFFAIHGGLSPTIVSLDQLKVLDRFLEVPHEGPLADLMWSDPTEDKSGWHHSNRGCGYLFGADVVKKFLRTNDQELIIRAHQLCMDGYNLMFDSALVTVWSAPNYCYRCGNIASVMEIAEDLSQNFNTFDAAPSANRLTPTENNTEGQALPEYFL